MFHLKHGRLIDTSAEHTATLLGNGILLIYGGTEFGFWEVIAPSP